MSIGTVLILVLAIAMVAMHLRGHGGQGGHGGGHEGGCGGEHDRNSTVGDASDTTVSRDENTDPAPSGASEHHGHTHG